MEKKKILLTDLDPNTGQVEGLPANPREWLKRDVRSLADSMRDTPELVEARGLIVYPYAGRYVIIGGNMRYEAAKLLHWKDIDCVVLPEDTTSGKLKEILLKDNSTFGVWQFKKLKEDFGEFEFQDLGIKFPEMPKGDKKADEDNYNPEKVLNSMREPKTKRGDAYRMGEHILICGDCTDVKVLERLFSIGGGQNKRTCC